MMHPAHQLPDWFLVNELDRSGCWAVREGADEAPALRVAYGTEENMRMTSAAIKMAKLLALMYRNRNWDENSVVMFKTRIEAVLRQAGVTP